MVTLSGSDRSQLEKAVLKARDVSEEGVRKRLAAMDLTHEERPAGIKDDANELRKALRVRARHLGRGRVDAHLANNEAVEQGLPFLVEELAYEAWHRMLFARFLAENELLTHPELGIPVSTEDLFALAAEEGRDPWELAADYASNRLPGLFALKTPLRLATEDRQDLTQILGSLDASLFTASDSLGWVYQFWQAKRKKEVNAAGNKIDGNTLPAVTQLFTEDYMVDFLLQNSLGAWYVARHPETRLKENWPYLRFLDDGTPAAGTFPTWPDDIAEVTVMDPCCGSGHFLVAALHMLVDMRMEVEGISDSDATERVLQHNLFGLELDARCTQIATFAVALEAWKRGGHPEKNLPQVACSGTPVGGQKEDWLKAASGDRNLEIALSSLYSQFAHATELGSLITPHRAGTMGMELRSGQQGLLLHEWSRISDRLRSAMNELDQSSLTTSIFSADGLADTIRSARLLEQHYTLIATNVPYLSRSSHDDSLRKFADGHYPHASADLATIFYERCIEFVSFGKNPGSLAVVTPQNWLFLGAYKNLRSEVLVRDSLDFVARLGSGAFRTISGVVVNVALVIATGSAPLPNHRFAFSDVSSESSAVQKANALIEHEFGLGYQSEQSRNPDSVIAGYSLGSRDLLSKYATSTVGIQTGDNMRFLRNFWEINFADGLWDTEQDAVSYSSNASGRQNAILWGNGNGPMHEFIRARMAGNTNAWIRGTHLVGRQGIAVNRMGDLHCAPYSGRLFSENVAVITPNDSNDLLPIYAYLSSDAFRENVRRINQKPMVTNQTLLKVPFEKEHWESVAAEILPDGMPRFSLELSTDWDFNGGLLASNQVLQAAMARMLGYRWPEQVEDGLDALADPDGIVCLPSVYQEPPAHQRLLEVLQRAYGDAWSNEVLTGLLQQVNATSLEAWLADKNGFFLQHTKLFHNRPFLWQITDGRKDGFSAIVNYHRLDSATLNKLIHTYLGDWIQRQQRAAAQGEAGAQGRLEAATALKAKLDAIYAGEPPYDIYVRWKPLAEQSIGWNPDLNDGVRLNIRPFIEAGVLANKVTVNWNKDRGKDPFVREEPLLSDTRDPDLRKRLELHGSVDRWNDLHFSRAEKERARALASQVE